MHYHFIPTTPPIIAPPPASNGELAPSFLLGICQQPIEFLAMWKSLGINVLVDIPLNRTLAEKLAWIKEANRLKLWQIREIVAGSDDSYLLAVSSGDEPDLHKRPVSDLLTLRQTVDKKYPIFTNIDGSHLLGIQKPDADFPLDYQGYVDASDWLCSDIYPISGWNVRDGFPNGDVDLFSPGRASDRLLELSGGRKPVLQYVETAVQNLSWLPSTQRAPTVVETSLILRQATSRKLKGVVFYTIAQGAAWPKDFDLTTFEMKNLIAEFCAQQKA